MGAKISLKSFENLEAENSKYVAQFDGKERRFRIEEKNTFSRYMFIDAKDIDAFTEVVTAINQAYSGEVEVESGR